MVPLSKINDPHVEVQAKLVHDNLDFAAVGGSGDDIERIGRALRGSEGSVPAERRPSLSAPDQDPEPRPAAVARIIPDPHATYRSGPGPSSLVAERSGQTPPPSAGGEDEQSNQGEAGGFVA